MKPLTLPLGESWSLSPNPDVGCFQPGDLPGDSHKAAPCEVTNLHILSGPWEMRHSLPSRTMHPVGRAETHSTLHIRSHRVGTGHTGEGASPEDRSSAHTTH